ncbi:hypothetical protein PC113_g21736 [Phytophthora cactorum]|uniref:Tetratricopeptide repeat n=1 Tax=Phytophthora cactorum TaxID=29920 RepID=A0A8T0Y7M9_9STRA|nr:hypothetical protein PC111_g21593 [Phytophthora cactorum]KAG2826632.1 hypothetical protein PC113_g21736 [Phytophthora cactorum]
MGNRDCAKKLYDTILEVYPRFTDCLLRLDCMLRDRGHEADAIKMFDKKKYEKVMGMPGLKNDPYAFLSMGNIFMSNLGKKNRYTKNMSLSEGNFELAKQISSQVREASSDIPDTWINLAHIFVAEKHYQETIQLYTVCLTKCYHGHDLEVLLYLAKAYYESKDFLSCIATLSRGLHMYPNDLRLWYNTYLAQEEYAVTALGQETTVTRSYSGIAVPQLPSVASGTSSPSEKKKHHNSLSFDKETVSDYEKFCGDTLTKASYHLEFERQKEEKRRLEIETQCKLLREYEECVAREQEEARVKEDDLRRRHEAIQLKQDERLK